MSPLTLAQLLVVPVAAVAGGVIGAGCGLVFSGELGLFASVFALVFAAVFAYAASEALDQGRGHAITA